MPPPRPPGLTRSALVARALGRAPRPGALCPTGKVPFASYAEARERVRWLSKRGRSLADRPGALEVFACSGCGHYHLGHRPLKRWRRRKDGAA